MAALPVYDVYGVASLDGIYDIIPPHHLRLRGVGSVRDSLPLIQGLTRKVCQGLRWTIDDCARLRLVVRLRERLRFVCYHLLRVLIMEPGNLDAHRRLRTYEEGIRHIGRETAPGMLRFLAIKLGNRLKKVAAKMIAGKRSPAWFEARRPSLGEHVRKVYLEHHVSLELL